MILTNKSIKKYPLFLKQGKQGKQSIKVCEEVVLGHL